MVAATVSFHSALRRSGMATHGHVSSAVSQRCYSLGRCRRSGSAIPIPKAGPAVSGGGRFSYAFAVVARQFHRSFPHSSLPRSPGIRRAGVCRRAGAHSRPPATCPGGNPVLVRRPARGSAMPRGDSAPRVTGLRGAVGRSFSAEPCPSASGFQSGFASIACAVSIFLMLVSSPGGRGVPGLLPACSAAFRVLCGSVGLRGHWMWRS